MSKISKITMGPAFCRLRPVRAHQQVDLVQEVIAMIVETVVAVIEKTINDRIEIKIDRMDHSDETA